MSLIREEWFQSDSINAGSEIDPKNPSSLIESITDSYFTDLICEGPIEGFCDIHGNVIQPNFIEEDENALNTDEERKRVFDHNKEERNKLLKAFYVDNVPLIDDSGDYNLEQIEFDFNLGYTPKIPGSSLGDSVFYRPRTVYPKANLLVGPKAQWEERLVGTFGTKFLYTWITAEELSEYNVDNPTDYAKKRGASPVFHTVNNPWIQNVNINFTLNQLFHQDSSNNTQPLSLWLSIRVRNDGEEWQNVLNINKDDLGEDHKNTHGIPSKQIGLYPKDLIWVENHLDNPDHGVLEIKGIATSAASIQIPIALPENPGGKKRIIEIVKLSPERIPTNGIGTHGGRRVDNMLGGKNAFSSISTASIEEINPIKFNYPNSVVISSRYNSASFNKAPERTWDLKLKKVKVPSNYNPETKTYNGMWDGRFAQGLHWTDNPAWIFYDLATNPIYGLGKFNILPKNIDKWSLYKISRYCDELVRTGYDPYYSVLDFIVDPENPNIILVPVTQDNANGRLEGRFSGTELRSQFSNGSKLSIFGRSDDLNNTQIDIVDVQHVTEGDVAHVPSQYLTLSNFIDDRQLGEDDLYEYFIIKTKQALPVGINGDCALEVLNYPVLEPRFSCNLYLTQRAEALKLLTDIASIFNGMIYWFGGKVFLSNDSPKEPSVLFNNSNVKDGRFDYSGSAKTTKFSVVKVAYVDKDDNYQRKIEYVEDSDSIIKYGYLEKEVTAFGCTSRGQAHRLAKWVLATNRSENQVVNFSASIEASILRPGDVISISDNNKHQQRVGGRLLKIDPENAKLYLDEGLDVDVVGSKVTLITPRKNESSESLFLKGKVSEDDIDNRSSAQITTLIIEDQDIKGRILTVSIDSDGDYSDKSLLDILNSCPSNSLWVVSVDNNIINTKPVKYRVITVVEEDGDFGVMALQYNSDKFDSVEKDIILERNNLPKANLDPQFLKLKSPNGPTPPLLLTKEYRSNGESAKITSQWSAPEVLPLDSDGNEVGSVNYVIDYYKNNSLKLRQAIKGKDGVSSYTDTIDIGDDYGYYKVNVYSEYQGIKSKNFISESIDVPITGEFNGYNIVNASFTQNETATRNNPAGIGLTGEFSSNSVEFYWEVSDPRLPNKRLMESDLFSSDKYSNVSLKHFNLELLTGNTVVDSKPEHKSTRYMIPDLKEITNESREATLRIISVAQSGDSEIYSTGYISGKNFAPQLSSLSYEYIDRALNITVESNDSDFQGVTVYRTGLGLEESLPGGDFDIANAEIATPSDGSSFLVSNSSFLHDRNKAYYYKFLPFDSFGTGVLTGLYDDDGSLFAVEDSLNITDLRYSVSSDGDIEFGWNLTDAFGTVVDVSKYNAGVNDFLESKIHSYLINLRDDTSDLIQPNAAVRYNIPFEKLSSTGIKFKKEGDLAPKRALSLDINEFYTNFDDYNDVGAEYVLTGFMDNAGGVVDGGITTKLSKSIAGTRVINLIDGLLGSQVASGYILYTSPVSRMISISPVESYFNFDKDTNNLAYSAVHSGGFSITNNIGENLQTTSITKNTLVPTSGKRSIDFEVNLVTSSGTVFQNLDYEILTSQRITGSKPAPRLSNVGIYADPNTQPGSIIFKNINYTPGEVENDITKVDVYTGGPSETFDADEEHFAFSIKGPYGTNSKNTSSNFASEQNVIIHQNVPIDNTELSKNYKYHFLPYDQFGSGEITKNIQAYVINPYRMYDHLDFTAPNEVSSFVVNGGFGRDYNITWTDDNADNKQSDINQDVDHYEIWKTTGTPFNTLKSGSPASDFPNQNFVALTAKETELQVNTDPSGEIINAQLLTTTADRNIVIENDDNSDVGYFWIRTVDKNGNKSEFYPDGAGQQNKDKTIPLPPTGLSISSSFETFYLNWTASIDTDVREYEIWKSSNQQLKSGSTFITDDTINSGYIYLDDDDQVISDPWTGGPQQLVATVPYGQTATSVGGATNDTAYFWIRAVDFQNNKSKFINSVTGIGDTLGSIGSTDIDDFAIDASKTFSNIPVVSGDSWTDYNPTSSCVGWNSHKLVYSGQIYCISAGETSGKYIWWEQPDVNNYPTPMNYSTGHNNPGDDTTTFKDNHFVIATNVNGNHDLAWNAIANQVIGSAYIQDASIDSAKIRELTADRIRAGIISGQDIEITPSGDFIGSIKTQDFGTLESGFALSGDGTFHFKGGNASLKFDNNGRLELVGSLINSTVQEDLTKLEPDGGTVATFIGGGYNNEITQLGPTSTGTASFIGAGGCNYIGGSYSSIIGGYNNTGYDHLSVIGGGAYNYMASGFFEDEASDPINPIIIEAKEGLNVIAGGLSNYIGFSSKGFIGGGFYNTLGGSQFSSVVGGVNNFITGSRYSQILGGRNGTICSGQSNYIGAGCFNSVCVNKTSNFGQMSSVSNGYFNRVKNSSKSVILNGHLNAITTEIDFSSDQNVILNGCCNCVSGFGFNSTILNGKKNSLVNSLKVTYLGGKNIVSTGVCNSLAFGSCICLTQDSNGNIVFTDNDPGRTSCIVSNRMSDNSATFYFCEGVYFENTKACSTVCFKAPVICATSCIRSSNRLQAGYECSGQYVYPLLIHNCSLETGHTVGIAFCNRNDAGTWCASSWWRSSLQDLTAGSECSTLEIERRQNGSAYKVLCSQPNGRTYMCGALCARGGVLAPSVNAGNLIVQDWYVGYSDKFKFCTSAGPIACISSAGSFTGIYSNYDVVAYSDCRGKSNIATIDNAVDKVNKLQGRTYNRNDMGGKHYGLVAQEVAQAIPELAFSGNNGDAYGVKYQNTVALLIEAIKEQSVEISGLKQKVKDLL